MFGLNSSYFLPIILGVFIVFLEFFFNGDEQQEKSLTPNIFIGIISARRHFSERKAVRDSWIPNLKKYQNVKYKFFVGKKCTNHPLDRLDKFSCDGFDLSSYDSDDNFTSGVPLLKNVDCTNDAVISNSPKVVKNCYTSFGFRVLHPIRLHSFAVRVEFLREDQHIFLTFKDAEEDFEKVQVHSKACSKVVNGFCFFNLQENYILPKDFEGAVILSGGGNFTLKNGVCRWKSDGIFVFTFGAYGDHLEKYQDSVCTSVIANFSLEDKESFKNHAKLKFRRQAEWQEEEAEVDKDLNIEINSYGDIVYLHQIVDVYRNLPSKVLEMIKWSHANYPSSLVMKLDDDVQVNVPALMNFISHEITSERGLNIWSHFYHYRSVPRFGKWADFEFQGLSYPPFPCGSGYLLSDRLVYLLSMQAPFLRSFQGEDVSMGIWTQILRLGKDIVSKMHVDCWIPSESCNQSIIIPEILPHQINIDR